MTENNTPHDKVILPFLLHKWASNFQSLCSSIPCPVKSLLWSWRYCPFKLGHRFHALLKVCSDRDDIVPLNKLMFPKIAVVLSPKRKLCSKMWTKCDGFNWPKTSKIITPALSICWLQFLTSPREAVKTLRERSSTTNLTSCCCFFLAMTLPDTSWDKTDLISHYVVKLFFKGKV